MGKEKIKFILSQFLNTPAIDDTCYFIDIIDEFIKELTSIPPQPITKLVELQAEEIKDEYGYHRRYVDDDLRECLVLTLDPMPERKSWI